MTTIANETIIKTAKAAGQNAELKKYASILRVIARNLSYNNEQSEAIAKHKLHEIAIKLDQHEKKEHKTVYMQCAEVFAKLSKARRAQVGAVLVTKQGLVIPGVNGTPTGTDNNCEIEHRSNDGGSLLATKQEVLHAELNCLLKAAREGVSILDSEIFVTLSPCLSCSAMLKQAGVRKVYFREQYRDNSGVEYLVKNGVEVERI